MVSEKTHEQLSKLGRYDDKMEDIIRRLMAYYITEELEGKKETLSDLRDFPIIADDIIDRTIPTSEED